MNGARKPFASSGGGGIFRTLLLVAEDLLDMRVRWLLPDIDTAIAGIKGFTIDTVVLVSCVLPVLIVGATGGKEPGFSAIRSRWLGSSPSIFWLFDSLKYSILSLWRL